MKQIFPLLAAGVLVAGFFLGRPGHPALIPEHYIQALVGGNSIWANFFASVAGAFMYFATLIEVPILQGLLGAGMGQGPALALLLAGPALSLPNMLVIGGVLGLKKTAAFCGIIVIFYHCRHVLRMDSIVKTHFKPCLVKLFMGVLKAKPAVKIGC